MGLFGFSSGHEVNARYIAFPRKALTPPKILAN